MKKHKIIKIREHAELLQAASAWFHSKWGIPEKAYLESMKDCINGNSPVPQWYIIVENEKMIAGLGVIENDFHDRKDLTPNVCAVYVDENHRNQGIAGQLLEFVCTDFHNMGIDALYLITDHTTFYEKYGWEFLCMAQSDGEAELTRLYVHKH